MPYETELRITNNSLGKQKIIILLHLAELSIFNIKKIEL